MTITDIGTTDKQRSSSGRRFWLHAVALAIILVGISYWLDNGSIAIADEGVYAAQSANLSKGSWSNPQTLPQIDTDGWHNPLIGSAVVGNRAIPYANHPSYPLLLAPFYKLGGLTALLLASATGAWVAAVSSGKIAEFLDPRFAIAALWLTGIGSPVLFYGQVVMAHSLAAGLAGLLALSLLHSWKPNPDCSSRPSTAIWVATTLGAAACATGLVLIRSEGSLLAGSAAVVGAVLSMRLVNWRPRCDWSRAASSCVVGVTTLIAYILNGRWASSITNQTVGASGSITRITDPIGQAWVSLLRPWSETRYASVFAGLTVLCCVLAPLLSRLLPRRPLLPVALLCLAAFAAAIRLFEEPNMISGLFAAAPVITIGLLLLGRAELRSESILFLLGTSALTTAGILWFSYAQGGATEWGGRFFSVIVPLLIPVGVATIMRAGSKVDMSFRRVAGTALAVIVASLSLSSLRAINFIKGFDAELVQSTLERASQWPTGTLVAVATVSPSGGSRLFWSEVLAGYPILNGGNIATFGALLPKISADGRSQVLVVTDTVPSNFEHVIATVQDRMGSKPVWSVSEAHPLGETGLVFLVVSSDG